MENDPKFWFLKLSYRLLVPISWEGWLITCGLALALFLIHAQMVVAGNEPLFTTCVAPPPGAIILPGPSVFSLTGV